MASRPRAQKTSCSELQRLDELQSMFISIAAHELRTPITPLRGYIEMFEDGDFGALTTRQHEMLRVLQESVQRLEELTNHLLDITRVEAGRLALNAKPTDVNALIREVIRDLEPLLADQKQKLVLHLDAALPPVHCDAARIRQVLSILTTNATRYTPVGGSISVCAERAQIGVVKIGIRDTGSGIPLSDQPHVFRHFYRAPNATAHGTRGGGLGLHLARSLVQLHSGEIWFESQVGRGSTFYFTLPVSD